MAFVYHFKPRSMSADKYDECMARLTAAGAASPRGRTHHVVYGSPDGLQVFDIWDSAEAFEAFGKVLVPVLQELGIDAGAPEVSEVHSVVGTP